MKNIDNIRIIRFSQNQNDFISLVLPFEVISELSEVREYAKHPDGYQRTPNRNHYLKVKSYVLNNKGDYKFPSSIILGADQQQFTRDFIKKDGCGEYLNLSNKKLAKIFRVVDGQHRIEGLKLALKDDQSIKNLLLPVIIILTKENKKSTELEIFTQINSTAKRISTDLAELAKHSHQIKENKIEEKDVVMFICMETAYRLKEKGANSVWNSGIKFDIHSEVSLGIVGVTLFCESIENIVEGYIDKGIIKQFISANKKDELIKYCQKISLKIADFIDLIWNSVIKPKWANCFVKDVVKNESGELVDIFYSKNFYIQNTLGVKALNNILGDSIKKNGVGDKSLNEFKLIIKNSKVSSKDWAKGGPFSGLSSESGFGKVRKIIKNEILIQNI